jgi:hypothetical protein
VNTFDLIAESIRDEWIDLPVEPVMNVCAITGAEDVPCVPANKLFSGNFVGYNELAVPESKYVSVNAYQALKYRPQRGSSWIVSREYGFQRLRRIEVRPYILKGIDSKCWSAYVTTSYKKHGAFRGTINTENFGIWRFDDIHIDCSDSVLVNDWYNTLNTYLHFGINRIVLETAVLTPWAIKHVGIVECFRFMKWAKYKYKSALYQFLCYLLPSQEEIKNEKDV